MAARRCGLYEGLECCISKPTQRSGLKCMKEADGPHWGRSSGQRSEDKKGLLVTRGNSDFLLRGAGSDWSRGVIRHYYVIKDGLVHWGKNRLGEWARISEPKLSSWFSNPSLKWPVISHYFHPYPRHPATGHTYGHSETHFPTSGLVCTFVSAHAAPLLD